MTVQIKEVASKKDIRQFIYLPEKIHKNHPNWVYPLYVDEKQYYNPKKNKSFTHCDTKLILAYKDNKVVGRVMGIINRKYNESHQEFNARFFNLECYNDAEVAGALLADIEQWAVGKGMKKLVGPLGFSDKDPQGFLLEGFDQPMVIATNCSYPYMIDLMDNLNYQKEIDHVVYKLEVPKVIPELYKKVYQRTIERNHFSLLEFETRKELKPFIKPIFELINETYAHIYGFSEIEKAEMDYMANRYLPVIDPHFVKIISTPSGEIVGFILGMPDIAEGIRLAKGRLFPFGLFRIISSSKKTKLINLLLGAIKDEYRNNGFDAVMGVKMLESAIKSGHEIIDSHLMLENNVKMRAEFEKMGGIVYKKYRIFSKQLS